MVYSMLNIFTAVVCTRTGNSRCKVGYKLSRAPTHPADILAAALTGVEEGRCKNWKLVS